MRVTFSRTGERRYRVEVVRDALPTLVMDPAPGFDADLPHDLVHFLVERHWGLREGIYGDLAAGGDAGTFRMQEVTHDRRWARKHAGLATSGRDMQRSEALAAAAFAAWQAHAGRVASGSTYAREVTAAAGLAAEEMAAVMPACDEAAREWHALAVGDSLALDWPAPQTAARRARGTKSAR